MFRLSMKILAGMMILSIATTFVAFLLFLISWLFTLNCVEMFKKTMVVSFLAQLSCYVIYTILLIKQDSKKQIYGNYKNF